MASGVALSPAVASSRAILALDLGSHTGFAMTTGGPVHSGCAKFLRAKTEAPCGRFYRFRRWLSDNAPPELALVVYEDVRGHKGTYAAQIYGGFLAIMGSWCEARSIPYVGIHTGTLKRMTTGRGNADKGAMIAAVSSRGFTPKSDDEADAIALLLAVDHIPGAADGAPTLTVTR